MTTHRRLGMDWQASVASVAVQAAKAQKRSETASTGAVSRLRYETEKGSGFVTTSYVDEGDAATLESAKAYVVETVTDATVDLTGYCTTAAMQEYVAEYVDGIADGSY